MAGELAIQRRTKQMRLRGEIVVGGCAAYNKAEL